MTPATAVPRMTTTKTPTGAIPTAAAILAITDYLRERDVLLRSEPAGEDGAQASVADGIEPEATAAPASTAPGPSEP